MKGHLKLAIAFLMSFAMLFSSVATADVDAYTYNEYDVEKVRTFLEQTDSAGVKNGQKLFTEYSPEDPATWTSTVTGRPTFNWDTDGNLYEVIISNNAYDYDFSLNGDFNLDGCQSLYRVIVAALSDVPTVSFRECPALEIVSVQAKMWLEVIDEEEDETELHIFSETTLIDLYGSDALWSLLSINMTVLDDVNMEGCDSLRELTLQGTGMSTVALEECPSLTKLILTSNRITGVDLSYVPNLIQFEVGMDMNFTEVDLSHTPLLEHVGVPYCNLTSIDVSMLPNLKHLSVNGNSMSGIDVSHNPHLQNLYAIGCGFDNMDMSHNPELAIVMGSNNNMRSVDLTLQEGLLTMANFMGNPLRAVYSVIINGKVFKATAEGAGYISFSHGTENGSLVASPIQGAAFLGWYDMDGNRLSTSTYYATPKNVDVNVTGRFTPVEEVELQVTFVDGVTQEVIEVQAVHPFESAAAPAPEEHEGYTFLAWDKDFSLIDKNITVTSVYVSDDEHDVDGDGTISMNDCLLVLRQALNLIELDDYAMIVADFDRNGEISSGDALSLLRLYLA